MKKVTRSKRRDPSKAVLYCRTVGTGSTYVKNVLYYLEIL
jgi:hypothetical protein